MTAGQQLAFARLDRGWSLEEIAERLQVSVARIAAVENTDIGQLPSRIYLRDLVSEYAREVGLDPQQIEARYLAELDALAVRPHASLLTHATGVTDGTGGVPLVSRHDGNAATPADVLSQFVAETELNAGLRAPEPRGQSLAPVSPDAVPAAVSRPAHARPVDPAASAASAPAASAPIAAARSGAAAAARDKPISRQPASQTSRHGREPEDDVLSSLPLRLDGVDMPPLQHRRRRSGLRYVSGAGVGLIGMAALLYLGGVNISQPGGEFSRFVERLRDRLPRPTYADDSGGVPERSAEYPRAGEPLRTGMAPRSTPQTTSDGHSSTAGPTVTNRESPAASAPSVDPPLVAPAAKSAVADEPEAAHAHDVSGPWHLTNRVESAEYSRFRNMTLGFRLTLEQRGTHIVGEGYKSSENGKLLRSRRRTPIALEGRLEGERLVLNFTERGAARTSAGRFVLHVADDGSLRGRFTSDAARSFGSSIAIRQPPGV